MIIEKKLNQYIASGSINDTFVMGFGHTFIEALIDAFGEYDLYVKKIFQNPPMSAVDNLPIGYNDIDL